MEKWTVISSLIKLHINILQVKPYFYFENRKAILTLYPSNIRYQLPSTQQSHKERVAPTHDAESPSKALWTYRHTDTHEKACNAQHLGEGVHLSKREIESSKQFLGKWWCSLSLSCLCLGVHFMSMSCTEYFLQRERGEKDSILFLKRTIHNNTWTMHTQNHHNSSFISKMIHQLPELSNQVEETMIGHTQYVFNLGLRIVLKELQIRREITIQKLMPHVQQHGTADSQQHLLQNSQLHLRDVLASSTLACV